ncbi:hypothetical protein GCM10010123_39610 [Pilimelia anulata]|uniref:GerMN domain-containing protein n=1 Tax=Pilimelia anulata TaxID=53371 RepID=A0A8J3BAW2_9ACTN|nr:hypothetical protein GCM10010123_39610 [Pilimelia anulata]
MLGLAGCGVPGSGDVVVQERVGEAQVPSGDEGTWPLAERASITDPQEFLRNLLSATAGDPSQAAARVRTFADPRLRDRWQPPPTVHLVEVEGKPIIDQRVGGFDATVEVIHLGELSDKGVVLPRERQRRTYVFRLSLGPDGLYLTDAPPVLLLPTTDLQQYFERRTLYFWSTDGQYLVPDVRYLSRRDVPRAQWATQLVQWLLTGPSPLIRPVVRPTDADLVGNVISGGSRWTVNLSRAPFTDATRIATQLRWTLAEPSGRADPVSLQVGRDRVTDEDSRYLAANAAYRAQDPAPLCVLGGRVRQIGTLPPGAVSVPSLPAGYRGVLKAAYQRLGNARYAAVVRVAGRGRYTVDIGTGDANLFQHVRPTLLRARAIGQPAWVPTRALALVIADGRLYALRPRTSTVRPVAGAPAGTTAVAVAPDGRRVAFIAGGQLYTAGLAADGPTVSLANRVRLPLSQLTDPTAVAWIEQSRFAVTGRQPRIGQTQAWAMSADGALQEPLQLPTQGLGTVPVTQLVGVADDPSDGSAPGPLMYEANRLSYQELGGAPVTAERVLAPGPDADKLGYPTAPFFLS